jgi:flagellar biogenesis protein FliO
MLGSELATPALMVVGAAAVALFSRRLGPFFQHRSGRSDFPRHLGSLMLNPKCSVAVVQAGAETLLLGVTASSVTLLTKLPAAPAEPPPDRKETGEEVRLQ